jgi:DHA2 family multidrug resistance protein
MAGLFVFLREPPQAYRQRFDMFGFAWLALAIGSFQLFLDRGEQLEWFASTEIMIEAGLALLALYMFLVHVFTSDTAFLDVRMFGDRNFVVGQVLIFAIGAILLATLALLTPFLERLMNFPVLQAGLVLAPRGFGTMASMVLVGQLVSRTGPRLPIIAGLLLTAYALHEMAGFTPDVSQGAIIRTGIVQGFGLGLVFVPLSTATFATLAPRFRTQGTALYSLMRNLGSSVGISVTTMLLTRYTTIMHSNLVEHVNPFSLAVRNYADLLDLATPAGRAQMDQQVIVQASAIAYSNNFRLMAYAALAVIPLVLLLRGETYKAPTKVQAVAAR